MSVAEKQFDRDFRDLKSEITTMLKRLGNFKKKYKQNPNWELMK